MTGKGKFFASENHFIKLLQNSTEIVISNINSYNSFNKYRF